MLYSSLLLLALTKTDGCLSAGELVFGNEHELASMDWSKANLSEYRSSGGDDSANDVLVVEVPFRLADTGQEGAVRVEVVRQMQEVIHEVVEVYNRESPEVGF